MWIWSQVIHTFTKKKKKAKFSEISNPSALSSSRGRQKVRGVSSPKRRGRGRSAYSNRNERPASPSRSSRHTSPPPPTSSVARGTRGRPRGSRGTRLGRQGPGSQGASPGCAPSQTPSPALRGCEVGQRAEKGLSAGQPDIQLLLHLLHQLQVVQEGDHWGLLSQLC